MVNKTIIFLTVMLLLTSCSANKKLVKLFKEGHLQEQSFKVEIPYENRLGLIIIKVELNNETYDFVLDSGAGGTVISKELAETLGLKGLITKNVGGHQKDYSQSMDFTKIEALTIGGIKFEDTATGIGDLKQSIEVGCTEIDGIIGTNVMGLAVWKIDFINQMITLTNTKESLSLGAKTEKIPFYTNETHMPFCEVKINGVTQKHVIIDLGSPGGFSLSYDYFEEIQKELPINKKMTEYGYLASGIYGYGRIDSVYHLKPGSLSVGEINLNNHLIKISRSMNPTIGTAFFKNYDLVMNWKDKELLLSPHTEYENQEFIRTGFIFNYKEDALRIASLVKESAAEQSGMQLGDKIIQIDGKDYSNTTISDYCDLIKQVVKDNSIKNIKNIVINRNGERLSFDITNDFIIE